MATRCNKCGQADPHQSDSWCLACSALEAIDSELRSGWGTAGTRALATDLLASAVRQIRAARRLGLAGAGKGRARTPDGADRGRASKGQPREEVPPPPPVPEKAAPDTSLAAAGEAVKRESPEPPADSEYSEESEEEEIVREDDPPHESRCREATFGGET